jgi:hypothetical protein
MNLNVTRQNNQPPANPCQNSEVIACDQSMSYSLSSGNGSWNPPGPWGTPGNEQVIEFTATNSGVHQINMTHSGGGWVDLFIKSGNCNQNGWTYVDDIYSSGVNYITLNAGQTYYFLIDDENTSSSGGTINIVCPNPAQDPCNSLTALTCDQSESYSLSSGSGTWNPPGPWGTPGNESVFSYTPTISGSYDLTVTHSGGGWSDLFYKSGTCGSSGWTYVDDIYSSSTNSLYLNAGVTYYFLIDDENTTASSGTIQIACPCIGNSVDEVINLSGNIAITNNTSGACDDCGLRSSEDITYEVNVPCPGTYTFETCGLAQWDTYLYLTSSPCSGILASNDDNCSLRSSITYTFANAGTYYLTVEGFSSSSAGSFGMNIFRSCDLTVNLNTSQFECGYEISCNGVNDGVISAQASGCGATSYDWSNGSTGPIAIGLGAGNYSVTVTDSWGCSATASATLNEPDPLIVDAGNDATVYYGYTPLSCADLSGSATGGCADYNYSWSADGNALGSFEDLTVCPETSTLYTLDVTDVNGCTASADVNVCVIDVRCYAGNSGNQKVEVCHVPPGNPGNAHTICIDESAVATHLAHGCTLGSCDEVADCNATSRVMADKIEIVNSQEQMEFEVSPIPFEDAISIKLGEIEEDFYTVKLVSLQGRSIQILYSGYLSSGKKLERLLVNPIAEGVYIIQITNNKGVARVKKVMKL